MYKLIPFLGICVAFGLGSKIPLADKKVEKIVGCFYALNYDTGAMLQIEGIDVSLCTHIFYSFVVLDANASVKVFDPEGGMEVTGLKQFNGLRKKNPHLKTFVAIGDSTDVLDRYFGSIKSTVTDNRMTNVEILTNPNLREKLLNNIVNFVKKYGFDGVDLKFTDSPERGGNHSVKENLVSFLKALREKFDKERLILSATVSPDESTAKILYDIKGISEYVKFINLRTIEFYGTPELYKKNRVVHPSPMYASSEEHGEERKKNIDYVVKYWISQGAPPSKLLLGTSFYGMAYTLANRKQIGKGALFPKEGQCFGRFEYDYVCGLMKTWTHIYDKEQQVPYVYNSSQIFAYDDVESIKRKAEYAEKMKLGGVAVWNIDDDDFDGRCGEKFPLLKTFNRVLRNKH